jgi:flagellar M-ring protein FliF
MKEFIVNFWGTCREWWAGKSKGTRLLLLGSLAFILITALLMVMWINHTDYIVLYDNLTVAENAGVLAQLQEMGVQGQLDGTRILIPSDQENRVRMRLAMTSLPDSGFGFSTYAQGGGLTATQADRDRYGNFQDQERLEAMIRTFPEVREAHVTITMPETSVFVLQSQTEQPRVAVKIQKMPGRQISGEQVRGILNLVLHSVPGLTEENISIVDEAGDMKVLLGGDGVADKLKLTEEINETIRRRVTELLIPIYGPEGVVVRVNSVLDTDTRRTTSTLYELPDPDNPDSALVNYFEEEYQRQAANQPAQGVPGANDNINIPQYAGQIQDDGTGAYYSHHRIYDYLYSSTITEIEKQGLEITDMTLAVLIDADTLPNGQRDQILDLAIGASGIPGDKISVQNIGFRQEAVEEPIFTQNSFWLIIAITAGALALLVILIGLAIMSRRKKQQDQDALVYEEYDQDEYGELTLAELMQPQAAEDFEPIQLVETQEMKLKAQIKDLADSDPEIVAQLIKTWLMSA